MKLNCKVVVSGKAFYRKVDMASFEGILCMVIRRIEFGGKIKPIIFPCKYP